ncbi:hypothetical protein Phum_PHUM599830 [Pediculus humanus corporis]|uniref:Uncharacterized protein n=1 Tax=Pediculus humanus subsp. corporis TaxID=121224 RepID=E0W307_PEDHC|nr:uncharacterized protein Phum_PHUM599830 [Pediculus humanus corporis]EEB20013.1 hypothetical protein Phum_PHUM599830 [Pediculus humanus corporis]
MEKLIGKKTRDNKTFSKPFPDRVENRKKLIKENVWLKKRYEARILRRRMKEPCPRISPTIKTADRPAKPNLPVKKDEKNEKNILLPSLYEVLETLKDAWPPHQPIQKNFNLFK